MSEPWEDRAPARASWRGIAFEWESTSDQFGHRVVVHEYPQRGTPYAESMGRKARTFGLTAYVIGPNYDLDVLKLIEAAERGDEGTFTHPVFGPLTCKLTTATVVSRDRERRMATLQLQFVEAGENLFPVAAADTSTAASAHATAASTAATAVTTSAETTLATQPIWARNDYARFVVKHSQRLAKASRISLDADEDIRTVIGGIEDVYQALALVAAVPADIFADLESAWSTVVRAAEEAWGSDVRVQSIARAASLTIATEWDTYEQAEGVSGRVVSAIDAELALAEDQTLIESLVDLRASVLASLQDAETTADQLTTLEVRDPTPAHVIAYRLYGDPERDAEIVARNAPRDPGHVWGTLTVAAPS